MSPRAYSLRTFVHRVLALRLAAATLAIAALFGGITGYRGYDRIGAEVVQVARNGIEWMRVGVRQRLETGGPNLAGAMQQVLNAGPVQRPDRRYGQFVYARFYDPRGTGLAERLQPLDADADALKAQIAATARQFPQAEDGWHGQIDIGGRPYFHLVIPVADRHGTTIAYAEGLFRISDETVAQVRRHALQTAGYVGLIVLTTALLLYPVILTLMRRLARYSEQLVASNLETLEVLGSAIAKRDSDTDAHNYRVTLYALRLAEAAGLDGEQRRTLIKGAFLHDVGKIGIRDHILHKPARLDPDEFAVMQTHVNHGLDIVRRSAWLADAEDVVGGHHEKYDGSGYPNAAAGGSIPAAARIFAIADVFDALTSRRPYKEPLSFDETMQILDSGRGRHFDPALLDRFATIARELYDRYCGRDDERLRDEVRTVVQRWFVGGLDTLRY